MAAAALLAHLPVQLPPALEDAFQKLHAVHIKFQGVLSTEHNCIPHMAWEAQLAAAGGISYDQARFIVALFASVVLAGGIRLIRNPTLRHLYALVTGVALIYYPFGSGIIHTLPMAAAAYAAMLVAPRKAGPIAWATIFTYLLYLHVCNASGAAWRAGKLDFTGGAMVLVLKLVSLCACRQDSFKKDKEELTPYQASHALPRLPSPLEFLSYIFGLGNLLAGPWIEFAEYKEFIELKGVWDPKAARPIPGTLLPGLAFLAEGLVYMAMYLGLTLNGWDLSHYLSDWYFAQPLYIKAVSFIIIGSVYQLRFYFCWKITEASLTLAGLNWLGWQEEGPGGKLKPKWGRCANVNFWGVWLADSARNVPLNWNICTGTFLRRYVYERVTPKGRKPGFTSLLFTQLVSGVWHGLYPGYLLFFSGTAVWIYFSQIVYKTEAYLPSIIRNSLPFRALKVLWTTFVLNYMAASFQLLSYEESMASYATLSYLPFTLMLAVNVLGSFVKAKRPPGGAKAARGSGGGKGAEGAAAGGSKPPVAGAAAAANGHGKGE